MNLQIPEQTANQYWNIALHSPKLGRNEHIHVTTACSRQSSSTGSLSSQLYCSPLNIPTGTLALILAAYATTVFRNEQMCRGLVRESNIEWILKAYWWKLKCRATKIRTSFFQIFSRKRKKVIIADSNSNPKVTEYRQAYFINDLLFSQLNLLCPPTLTIGEKICDINYYRLRGLSFFFVMTSY